MSKAKSDLLNLESCFLLSFPFVDESGQQGTILDRETIARSSRLRSEDAKPNENDGDFHEIQQQR